MRSVVAILICIAFCALNGCSIGRAGYFRIHPLSAVTKPEFCFYNNAKKPKPIRWLEVRDNKETLWELVYAPEEPGTPTWESKYEPPSPPDIPARPFSCITYGRAPPGYQEKTPAAPLMPDTWYSARVHYRAGGVYPAHLRFIIRPDSSGQSGTLEYHYYRGDYIRAHVSPNRNTNEGTR